MKLLWITLLTITSSVSCTLYQSPGREAIEKDTNQIVTKTGTSLNQTISYTCYRSLTAPAEMSGPLQVIESQYDEQGFSSYFYRSEDAPYILVYESSIDENDLLQHTYCRMKMLSEPSLELSYEAIDLGVFQLLDPSTRP